MHGSKGVCTQEQFRIQQQLWWELEGHRRYVALGQVCNIHNIQLHVMQSLSDPMPSHCSLKRQHPGTGQWPFSGGVKRPSCEGVSGCMHRPASKHADDIGTTWHCRLPQWHWSMQPDNNTCIPTTG